MQVEKIVTELESARPILSEEERLRVWEEIMTTVPTPAPIKQQPVISPYIPAAIVTFTFKKIMTPLIIVLIITLGGGATVFASDAARPGDMLYTLDRAVENMQLRLVGDEEKRLNLTETLTEERLLELREIIDEEIVLSPTNIDLSQETTFESATGTIADLEIEAHVYVDTTVVKLELSGKKFYFETTATTTEAVAAAVLGRFPILTNEQINEVLYLEIEDRPSRPKDRGIVTLSEDGEQRINFAIKSLLEFLDEIKLAETDQNVVLALLSDEESGVTKPTKVTRVRDRFEIGDDDGRVKIKITDDGGNEVEIRQGELRLNIEEEAGEVFMNIATEELSAEEVFSIPEIEIDFEASAEIFTDTTVVRITFSGDDIYFKTTAEDRNGIIEAIRERFPALTSEQIAAELIIRERNRASRPEDLGLEPVPEIASPLSPPISDSRDEDEDEDEDREDEDEDHEDEDKEEDEDREDREDEDKEEDHEEDEENDEVSEV